MAKRAEGEKRKARKLRSRELKAVEHSGRVYVSADGRKVDAQEIDWDSEIRGLGLRMYARGRASRVLRYYVGRRRRLVKLADASVVNPKKERVLAADRLAELTSSRRDPFATGKGLAVRDLVAPFLEDAARRNSLAAREGRLAPVRRGTHRLRVPGDRQLGEDVRQPLTGRSRRRPASPRRR